MEQAVVEEQMVVEGRSKEEEGREEEEGHERCDMDEEPARGKHMLPEKKRAGHGSLTELAGCRRDE